MKGQDRRSEAVPRGYTRLDALAAEVRDALAAYTELVRAWAPRLDLVAAGDLACFGERHIDDSLRAIALVDGLPMGPAVDVGSGAGLPGVPLAVAARHRSWRLLEPRRRRAAFLEEVVRELELDHVVVARSSAEQEAASGRRYALATARALAPPPEAFRLLLPLLDPGGTALVWVGRSAQLPPEAGLSAEGLATIRRG